MQYFSLVKDDEVEWVLKGYQNYIIFYIILFYFKMERCAQLNQEHQLRTVLFSGNHLQKESTNNQKKPQNNLNW